VKPPIWNNLESRFVFQIAESATRNQAATHPNRVRRTPLARRHLGTDSLESGSAARVIFHFVSYQIFSDCTWHKIWGHRTSGWSSCSSLRKSGAMFGDVRVRPDSPWRTLPGMLIDGHQSCMHRFARMLTLAKGCHTEFIIVNKILVMAATGQPAGSES